MRISASSSSTRKLRARASLFIRGGIINLEILDASPNRSSLEDLCIINRNRSQSSRRNATSGSYTGSYKEEACKYYNRRMQEEYEDEMERLERIRRMQSVFNRERNKRNKSSESWREHGHDAYQYQHFERNDWYWHTDTSYKDQRANFRPNPRESGNFKMSHHYSVLGLDRSRAKPYSEVEIKSAFRAKAKEYHPDQNQNNKESAEAKFKEVMTSYEAIKSERKNNGC